MNFKSILQGLKKGSADKKSDAKAQASSSQPGAEAPANAKPSSMGKPASPASVSRKAKTAESVANNSASGSRILNTPIPAELTVNFMVYNIAALDGLLQHKAVQENTPDGLRMVNFVLDTPELFYRWLSPARLLREFLEVFPEKQQQCVDNILRWEETWPAFLNSQRTLYGFIDLCVRQRRQILAVVFSHKEVYSKFFSRQVIGEFLERMEQIDREEKLIGEESYRHKAMMILATEVELYNQCIMGSDDFWEWQNDPKNEAYCDALFMHHITNNDAYQDLFGYHDHLSSVLEKFPHKRQAIFDFIFSTSERFKHSFPSLFAINSFTPDHQSNAEQKTLRQDLFEHSKTIPGYEKKGVYLVTDLTKLCNIAPDLGQYVVDKMALDPAWLMGATSLNKELKAFFSDDRYIPLKAVFLATLYSDPKMFTKRIMDEADLKLFITLLPEEEVNLRHYYDVHYAHHSANPSKM